MGPRLLLVLGLILTFLSGPWPRTGSATSLPWLRTAMIRILPAPSTNSLPAEHAAHSHLFPARGLAWLSIAEAISMRRMATTKRSTSLPPTPHQVSSPGRDPLAVSKDRPDWLLINSAISLSLRRATLETPAAMPFSSSHRTERQALLPLGL